MYYYTEWHVYNPFLCQIVTFTHLLIKKCGHWSNRNRELSLSGWKQVPLLSRVQEVWLDFFPVYAHFRFTHSCRVTNLEIARKRKICDTVAFTFDNLTKHRLIFQVSSFIICRSPIGDFRQNFHCQIFFSLAMVTKMVQLEALYGKIWTQQIDLTPSVWLHSSVGRAWHRYRGGHGFKSCWSPDIFSGFFLPIA